MAADTIHTIESAAELAKVTEKDILNWIDRGLRAVAVGRVSRRSGPRNYRIKEAWIMQFLDEESVRLAPRAAAAPPVPAVGGRRARATPRAVPGDEGSIGPLPWKRF